MNSQVSCLLTVLVPAILVAMAAISLNWYLNNSTDNTPTTSRVVVFDQSSHERPASGFDAQPQPYTNLDPTISLDDELAELQNNNTEGFVITDSQIIGPSQINTFADKNKLYTEKQEATKTFGQKSDYPSFQGTSEDAESPYESVSYSEDKHSAPLRSLINPTPPLELDSSGVTSPVTDSILNIEGQPSFVPTSVQPTGTQTAASFTARPSSDAPTRNCWDDLASGTQVCKPNCQPGAFGLPYMEGCQRWLNCTEINTDVLLVKLIGQGSTKKVYQGLWKDHQVAVSVLYVDQYRPDFLHGSAMLREFNHQHGFVQLVGACDDPNVLVTEFHRLGNLANLDKVLGLPEYSGRDTAVTRLGLCVQYVKTLNTLHSLKSGARVMCDSNDLDKILQQFLLTSDLQIVLNDMDALPQVKQIKNQKINIKCGHRQLTGNFVAPEQLWPFQNLLFNDEEMPSYDEKIDIWRIPDVSEFILSDVEGSDLVKLHLFEIHKRCKSHLPEDRPRAGDVLEKYIEVLKEFTSEN